MIINKPGAEFWHKGVLYRIGDTVVGSLQSEYAGLRGSIFEIRDGEDKETENATPDIYCSFEEPVLPADVVELEEIFSDLYEEKKTLADITLDMVIMAPDMLIVSTEPRRTISIYILTEDWAVEEDRGSNTYLFSDIFEAKANLNWLLANEISSGCIAEWIGSKDYVIETEKNSYVGWLEGRYCEYHYSISIVKREVSLSGVISSEAEK